MSKKNNKTKSKKSAVPTSDRSTYASKIAPKAISRTRNDLASWKQALRQADNVDEPRQARLMSLFNDIMLDGHLTSQVVLRYSAVESAPFALYRGTERADTETELIETTFISELVGHVFQSIFFGHSLCEIELKDGAYSTKLIPRTNVVPKRGELLLNDNAKPINYKEVREYGSWIIEFGKPDDYGLLNKAVPYALFKRFSLSCWSELCEIYGIPPRYIKTDTLDGAAMDRAESMLRDMGAAAWFIIDTNEDFQFAKGADTNGDVYKNLITLCNNEISLLISGAVIGQDTVNGSNSKEKTSLELLERINASDKRMIERAFKDIIIPALERIGYLPAGLTFKYEKEEDLTRLFEMVKELLRYKDISNEYINEKFGIECTDKIVVEPPTKKLSADFFD